MGMVPTAPLDSGFRRNDVSTAPLDSRVRGNDGENAGTKTLSAAP